MSLLERHAQELNYCSYCPKLCTFACPVSNAERTETVTPWAKMTLANLIRKGQLPLKAEHAEPLYHCLACRLCTAYCKHENDVAETLTTARTLLVDRGVIHPSLAGLREAMAVSGNPERVDIRPILDKLLGEERFMDGAQAVFFPDSATVLGRPNEITAAFSVFDKLNIDFVACYPGPDFSTGLQLHRAGLRAEFESFARRVARRLEGYKLIITPSPDAAYTLKALYLELGIKLGGRVRHMTEFLEPYLLNAELSRKREEIAACHDDSYLVRYLGLGKLFRKMVGLLYESEPVEMVWSGKKAYSAAGLASSYVHTSSSYPPLIAHERLRQVQEIGAKVMVTAAPAVAGMLEDVRKEGDPRIRTLTEDIDYCL